MYAWTPTVSLGGHFLFVSLCESALPATDLVLGLVLPSLNSEEALEATFLEVTFVAITPPCFVICLRHQTRLV